MYVFVCTCIKFANSTMAAAAVRQLSDRSHGLATSGSPTRRLYLPGFG